MIDFEYNYMVKVIEQCNNIQVLQRVTYSLLHTHMCVLRFCMVYMELLNSHFSTLIFISSFTLHFMCC